MHGVLTHDLYDWLRERHGDMALLEVLALAKNPIGFVCLMASSDDDFFAFIDGAAAVTAKPAAELLEDFGSYMAPSLLASHHELISPGWSALDVIENTESIIHRAVRTQTRDATPPVLRSSRLADGSVRIVYASRRKLCHFARGLIAGIGRSYGVTPVVEEPSCMLRGSDQCELLITA
ncbi:MAG: heme NO-binding domain-containing protein [Candidatus Eremiobacteraeota bacterium]|nr:heme NO-binding domain-containing protein [Candidatus Eremiobacteraeota bacterium]